MRKNPETISVDLFGSGGIEIELTVEEYHPLEPSNYCLDPGWTCFDNDIEYFVSESGDVWKQPENVIAGIARSIEKRSHLYG